MTQNTSLSYRDAGVDIDAGATISAETLARAEQENVPLFSTPAGTFTVVGQLAGMGVRGE